MKGKIKAVLPSLREKKRYLAFEAISEGAMLSFAQISSQIRDSCFSLLGEIESAKAGIWVLPDKWDSKSQRGLIRVSSKYLGHLKAAMALAGSSGKSTLIIRSLGASGMVNKAESYLTNSEVLKNGTNATSDDGV